ncbi:NAD(P)H-dependent oxidoreductase [Rapidithrix thailandica]|uniref:NAD(P)H-dependent oxidoreductase n=1 Tax=Rapidithrix thailandica TaxID=413964 RepID=A0AAW9SFB6_9BACT
MSLLDNLNWRYATKKMNGNTVPQEKLDYILEAARLAPSSSGLQPYTILVIKNREVIEKLKPASMMNERLFDDVSHLLVFASWNGYTQERVDEVFDRTLAERGLPGNTMDDYKNNLLAHYEPLGKEWQTNHSAKQAYISFGMAIAAAAEQKVDATPIEGFVPDAYDEILGLKEKGLKSAVVLALGYRDEANDWLVNLKKVRTPKEQFLIEIN